MRRRLAAMLVTAVTVIGFSPSPAAGSSADPLEYVALGDSYSAASGVLPPDPAAPLQCLRSLRNYPHVIAARTGAALTDVTCGATDTNDFFTPQYDGVAPQWTPSRGAPTW